jgi:alanyl-tRNA synthetase
VPGYDSCACCGLHVKITAEIGVMKIFSCVKFHEGVRLEIACGRKAMILLRSIFEQNRQVSQAFSAQMLETGEGARKINEQLSAQKQEIAALKAQLRQRIAADYAGAERAVHFEPCLASAEIRELADAMANFCSDFAAVFSGTDESGYGYCVISRSRDLRELGKAINAQLQGRGGGRPDCQQGSVKATKAEIEAFLKIN